MLEWGANLFCLLKKITGLVLLYALCRLLFYGFNYNYFSDLGFGQFIKILFFGIRFDLSAIILSNGLFILLYLLPFPFRVHFWYQQILKWLFLLVNSLAMIANCLDLAYFQFTLKRTTADVFNFFGGHIGNDAGRLIPLFLKEYWYIVIIAIGLCYLVAKVYKTTEKQVTLIWSIQEIGRQMLIYIASILAFIIIYRGGFQLKPISAVDAGEYASVKHAPLLVSTTFTILKTLDLESIEPKIYFENEIELNKNYSPIHIGETKGFKKLNVIVIVLESFSKEYIGSINGKSISYTPFLDSLIKHSLCFKNGFSNGKTSIHGIPSIVASIPTWMYEPYISSPYGSNQISSLANLLKEEGYFTAFFHGGTNGTMGFDAFSSLTGYDNYYGRSEYNNEKDYDGNWGIWDEEFLQYTANTINKEKRPFFATVFTLTSHHPYPVPAKYKGKFKEGPLEIEHSIGYSDYSLKQFFESAKKMSWYSNTLFVLCADHTGISSDPFYTNKVGNNSIPIIYFMPSDSSLNGISSTITQQIDIMPSILDYLNYPKNYFAFGNSVFDSSASHYAINFYSGQFGIIEDNYALGFDGEKSIDLYDFTKDSLLSTNLINSKKDKVIQMENKLKAVIQTYQQSLINNRMK